MARGPGDGPLIGGVDGAWRMDDWRAVGETTRIHRRGVVSPTDRGGAMRLQPVSVKDFGFLGNSLQVL